MKYNRLGNSGLQVSELAFGTWLNHENESSKNELHETVETARKLGINYFDTANEYGHGYSETVLGEVLKNFERSSLVISTKVFQPMGDWPNQSGLSRKHIYDQIDASLSRLQLDYIDIYFAHRYDEATPIEETCRAFSDIITDGRARYWGTSWWKPSQIAQAFSVCEANGWHRPIACQEHYSALWRVPQTELLSKVKELGMSVIAWSPLEMGVLTNKYRESIPKGSRGTTHAGAWMQLSDKSRSATNTAAEFAAVQGSQPTTAALRWVLQDEIVASGIIGARNQEQLHETITSFKSDTKIDLNHWGELLSDSAVYHGEG